MNYTIFITAALMATIAIAETNTTENIDVVKLLEAKYQRDMKTSEGRKFWHGKLVNHVADPSNVVVITTHEDGKVFKDPAKTVRPIDSVNAANKRLKRTVNRKGVPKKLADARQRRADEVNMGPTNVTVTITAGGTK